MTYQKILPITQLRQDVFRVTNRVYTDECSYVITDRSVPKAVIIPYSEYESLLETSVVREMFPNLKKDIAEVERDIASGAYKKYPTLAEVFAEEGFMVSSKVTKKHEVLNKNRTKSQKRTKKNS